jgi:EmrB/QacA subfamily drug resistance transporter
MRRYIIFAAVGIGMLMVSISGSVVSVAFPEIVADFNTSLIVAGWVLSVNLLSSITFMPVIGKLCDAWGTKSTYILCICLFTFGSLLCALAPNIEILILARFIQGIGSGGFLPSGTAIVAADFPDRRQQYIGLLSSVYAIGTIVGPNLGGWLTTDFGWQSNFWIFVPFGALALLSALTLVPNTRGDASKLDLAGAAFIVAILAALMVGISLMGNSEQGIPWLAVGLLFAFALALVIVFLRRQTRVKNPIIEVEMLREKRFLAANVYNFILGAGIFASVSFIPLYGVSIFGLSTFDSGLVMTPRSVGVLIASTLVSIYLLRLRYRWPMIIGTVGTALTLFLMAILTRANFAGWAISGFTLLAVVLLVNGVAQGITLPAANNACIELRPERVGTITGVRGMFRQIGGSIGISVVTLALHNSGTYQQGFFLVFIGMGVLLLISLPLIFIMPESPGTVPVAQKIAPSLR